jgi:hypothetical protein
MIALVKLSTSRLKSPLMAPTLLMPRFIINWPNTLRETVTNSKINCFITFLRK